jgi:hypothetical protein
LPAIGDSIFADLSICVTIEKSVLAGLDGSIRELNDDGDLIAFAAALARNRARFALPNGLDIVLKPLRDRLRRQRAKDIPEARFIGARNQCFNAYVDPRQTCRSTLDDRGGAQIESTNCTKAHPKSRLFTESVITLLRLFLPTVATIRQRGHYGRRWYVVESGFVLCNSWHLRLTTDDTRRK